MFHKIKIDGKTTQHGTKIYADDKEIRGVRSVQYNVSVNEVATVNLEVIPEKCSINDLVDLTLSVEVKNLRTAIKCIQLEMRLNKEFRDAVIASTASALIEHDISEESVTEIAEAVVERIFEGCN